MSSEWGKALCCLLDKLHSMPKRPEYIAYFLVKAGVSTKPAISSFYKVSMRSGQP